VKEIILGISEYLLNSIADDCVENAKKRISIFKKRKFKKKFIQNVDEDILNKFGNELFYDDLSKLINRNNLLDNMFQRCYCVESKNWKTNEEFIEDMLGDKFDSPVECGNAKSALEYIFNMFFDTLQEPEFDDTRRVINEVRLLRNQIINKIDGVSSQVQAVEDRLRSGDRAFTNNNYFADESIDEVQELIVNHKFATAEKLLGKLIEHIKDLSVKQKTKIYYQRAQIFINTNKLDKLNSVKNIIIDIDENSKYVLEIDFYVSAINKEISLLDSYLKKFGELDYSDIKLLEKEIEFHLHCVDFKKIENLIGDNGLLKQQYESNAFLNYSYGIVCTQKSQYKLALSYFEKAYKLKKHVIYKYNSLMVGYCCWHNDVNDKKRYDESVNEANSLIKELSKLKYINVWLPEDNQVMYWTALCKMNDFCNNDNEVSEMIKDIHLAIKDNIDIQGVVAHNYCVSGKYDKAIKILEPIYNQRSECAIDIILAYISLEKHDKALEVIDNIADEDLKKSPNITILKLTASANEVGYTAIRKDLLEGLDKYHNLYYFYHDALKLMISNKKSKDIKIVLSKYNRMVFSAYELFQLAKLFDKNELYDDCITIIDDRIHEDEKVCDLYIYVSSKINYRNSNFHKVITDSYSNGCRFKSLLSAYTTNLINERKYITAKKIIDEYCTLHGNDLTYAYLKVSYVAVTNKAIDVDDEVTILMKNEPDYNVLMNIALLKSKKGQWELAKDIANKALYEAKDDLNLEVIGTFVQFSFNNMDKKDVVDLPRVIDGSVATLVSKDGETRKIAVHKTNINLSYDGEENFGIENYSISSALSLRMKSKGKIGTDIPLKSKTYNVKEVIPLNVYYFRHCLNELTQNFPNNPYMRTISADSPEKLAIKMMELLKQDKSNKMGVFEMYNFKDSEYGVPISFFTNASAQEYVKNLVSILLMKNQNYYAGEINLFSEGEKYLLSLSSILLICYFNLDDKFEKIADRCLVVKQVETEIRQLLEDEIAYCDSEKGTVFLNDDEKTMSFFENNSESKLDFLNRILGFVEKLTKVENKIIKNDLLDFLEGRIVESDLNTISYCDCDNVIYVSEELFLRKMYCSIYSNKDHTSFWGLILSEKLLSEKKVMEKAIELSNHKFMYCINGELLFYLFLYIFDKDNVEGLEDNKLQFKQLLKFISEEENRPYYYNQFLGFLKLCYSNRISVFIVYEMVWEYLGLDNPQDYAINFVNNMKPAEE